MDRQIPSSVVLLGTYGAGKSHLLAALASLLFAQGKRVVFLPESPLVAEDLVFWLKLAFALPFADLPETMQRIAQFKTTDEFLEFSRSCRKDVYFLVDGLDQLELKVKDFVIALASSHFLVYTSYVLDATLTVGRATPVRIPSGLSADELAQWRHHSKSQLPISLSYQKVSFIEDSTSGVPALLQSLLDYPGETFGDIATKWRSGRIFQTAANQVTEFHTTTVKTLSPDQRRWHVQLMSACLTETVPEIRPGSHTSLYDPRYFYFDSENRGHCLSGWVRDTMTPLLRMEDPSMFTSDAWYSAVRTGSRNIRDTAITQICLSRIGAGGLPQADAKALRICTFRQDPMFGWMFEEAWKSPSGVTSFLCVPSAEICRFLTAVILRINPNDMTCHLIPLQITTSHVCTELASLFFAVIWHKWEAAIKEEGFKVVNTFVCFDSRTPQSAEICAQSSALREQVKFVSPQYTIRILSVSMLDPKLGRILEGEKYQSPPT